MSSHIGESVIGARRRVQFIVFWHAVPRSIALNRMKLSEVPLGEMASVVK